MTLRYDRKGLYGGDEDGYVISLGFSDDAIKEVNKMQRELFKEKMSILENSVDFVNTRQELRLYYGPFDDSKTLIDEIIGYIATLFEIKGADVKLVASIRSAREGLNNTDDLGEGLKSFDTLSKAIEPPHRSDLFSDRSLSYAFADPFRPSAQQFQYRGPSIFARSYQSRGFGFFDRQQNHDDYDDSYTPQRLSLS